MKRTAFFLILFGTLLFTTVCGIDNQGKRTGQKIEVQLDSGGGIYALYYKEHNLLGITTSSLTGEKYKGAYYLIGSCVNEDGINNINSQSQKFWQQLLVGETKEIKNEMVSPTTLCRGATYKMVFERPQENKIVVTITVDPLPQDYVSLSIPMDFTKIMDTFRFNNAHGYQKMTGFCNNLVWIAGEGESYNGLDQVCKIPNGGAAGRALISSTAGIKQIEACSADLGICIRRTILQGTFANLLAYNHHGTNNTEIDLGIFQPTGTLFYLKEEIEIIAQ